MSLSGSECSSGCESGWTRYLDDASNSTPFVENWKWSCGNGDQEDDQDLSMVSDASSGPPPPQYLYQDCAHSYGHKSSGNKKKGKQQQQQQKKSGAKEVGRRQPSLCLDDTASSPLSHFPQDNAPYNDHNSVENVYGFSQVYSAAAHPDESIPKKQLGFLKSSTKTKSGSFLGRKRQ